MYIEYVNEAGCIMFKIHLQISIAVSKFYILKLPPLCVQCVPYAKIKCDISFRDCVVNICVRGYIMF